MPAWSVPGCHSTSRAAHALEAGQDVLQRVVERMAHVQRAGDVGRRDDDAVGLAPRALGPAGAERARLLPCRVDAALDLGGLVGLVDHVLFRFRTVARYKARHAPLLSTPPPHRLAPSVTRNQPLVTSHAPQSPPKSQTRSIVLLAVAGFASQAQVRVDRLAAAADRRGFRHHRRARPRSWSRPMR